MSRRSQCALAVLAWVLTMTLPSAAAQIATTRHNLSITGPGTVKAATESQICIFCHAPHNAAPTAALWNRATPTATYTPYASSTAKANAGQPTGASLLCLSCHDGTIALGSVLSRSAAIAMSGGSTMPASSASLLGTDLSDDHPVSISYSSALAAARGDLAHPSTLTGPVRLDANGQLQCTACHDPHDDANGKFLVMSNRASALCAVCHLENYWAQSSHKSSTATWNGVAPNPWPHTSGTTVADNGCENCHRPHSAGGRKWLLNNAIEEANCYSYHNAQVAAKNIQAEFSKLSIHPVASATGVHDPVEPATVQSRHVECSDCHNPHADNATAGLLPGSLLGVRGVDIDGAPVAAATAEYQICFRCHADSPNLPAPRVARQIAQTNTRLEFATTNPSFHPIAGPGRSVNVPSLLPPWTTTSLVKCSDCHNNNTGPGAGGTGPKGPHGSTNVALLERPFSTATPTAGDICYKCHSQSVVTREEPHDRSEHLRWGCKACHDPHGISATQGNSIYNSRLINLSTTDTTPVSTDTGLKRYVDTVARQCYLTCHGEEHKGDRY